MVDIKEVADKVFWLEPKVAGTDNVFSSYLIREDEGVLIEPGPAAAIPDIREAMGRLEMKNLAYIVPTHIHVDHAGGAGTLAELYPSARVVVHPKGAKHLVDPSRLIESTKTVFGDAFQDVFGPVLPVPEARLLVPEDGDAIPVGGRELQVLYAPGHAPHHIVVFDRETRGLFCGEALGLPGRGSEPMPLPAVAPPSFDQELCLKTMETLRKLDARLLFFSHGGVGSNPEKLISVASENTRVLGDLILQSLKEGESAVAISGKVKDFASSRYGLELNDGDAVMTVGGYSIYFQSRGLV